MTVIKMNKEVTEKVQKIGNREIYQVQLHFKLLWNENTTSHMLSITFFR